MYDNETKQFRKVAIVKMGVMPNGIANLTGNRGLGPIEIGHRVEGLTLRAPEVGKTVAVLRTKTNGVSVLGLFETSLVTSVGGGYFTTQNSIYKIEDCEV